MLLNLIQLLEVKDLVLLLKKKYVHFPHIGGIKIGNRVWIGSNASIEKGSLEDTIIEDDVLIDDLVQIGHNVRVNKGPKSLLAAF